MVLEVGVTTDCAVVNGVIVVRLRTIVGNPDNAPPINQWGQCGGKDYTGSRVCQAPYKCTYVNEYWSYCT